jgi:hypothetical protein
MGRGVFAVASRYVVSFSVLGFFAACAFYVNGSTYASDGSAALAFAQAEIHDEDVTGSITPVSLAFVLPQHASMAAYKPVGTSGLLEFGSKDAPETTLDRGMVALLGFAGLLLIAAGVAHQAEARRARRLSRRCEEQTSRFHAHDDQLRRTLQQLESAQDLLQKRAKELSTLSKELSSQVVTQGAIDHVAVCFLSDMNHNRLTTSLVSLRPWSVRSTAL